MNKYRASMKIEVEALNQTAQIDNKQKVYSVVDFVVFFVASDESRRARLEQFRVAAIQSIRHINSSLFLLPARRHRCAVLQLFQIR